MNGQPKPGFYIVVALVVLALVIFAVVRSDIFAPKAKHRPDEPIDPNALKAKAEAPDTGNVTTVKEYKFVPSEKLPEVHCDRSSRFSLSPMGPTRSRWRKAARKYARCSGSIWVTGIDCPCQSACRWSTQ